ncbi:hypothetical protein C1645_776256 [Glomus cerebriforme]|uniref:F-box domain-containing protein n=1 Tax=Glomus cerebriforme TaxID=658196 RepID=A0A397SYB9_9GLOM|nr:hypothetical protein C1645_776256 [Glomus cerebriforme]
MEFTQRLPSEIFISIFKELDTKTLHSLSLVSKGCNTFAMDNHIWNHVALNRWEGKQGMAEICSEPHELWFKKAGTWRKVYSIIEQEARRSELNTDDLVETTWRFKFNSFPIPHVGSPNFHRDGIYTHNGMIEGQLPWTFTKEGQVRVDQFPPLKPFRSTTDWSLKMRNIHVTFVSTDHNCFRKKLYHFNLKLIEELGLDPSHYILHPPKPSFGLSNNSNEENHDDDDGNDQESMENNNENNNEGNENEEMDHIMVLPTNHVFHDDDDDDDNGDNDQNEDNHFVIFLSFQN